jgi:MarR family
MSDLISNFAHAPNVPLNEEGALNWLRSQPAGHVTATAAELGRRWGWHRQRVGRRLAAWAKSGLVTLHGDTVTVAEPALLVPVTPVPTDLTG